MGSAAVRIFTISALMGATSGAHVADRPGADAGKYISHKADENVTCILNETCTLPCSFKGELQEAFWIRQDKPMIPIAVHPQPEHPVQHVDYRNKAWMSLDQPGGGADLVIRAVELKHQGLHRCSVTSSTGDTDRFIDLRLYTPVLNVSVHQEGQQLFCRSEGIYPKPTVLWTPPGSDEPSTSVNETEDGLYTVISSVRLKRHSPAQTYTCNISTPYWWSIDSVTPPRDAALDNFYLWMLVLTVLVVVVAVAVTGALIYHHCKKNIQEKNSRSTNEEKATGEEREKFLSKA